ncbi:unnamed protein product [Caenorhabditis sp. 36 PRJEB53466]|nr:unnamed protein product [Caenorhabditis sp. 36 PRJEB53466]
MPSTYNTEPSDRMEVEEVKPKDPEEVKRVDEEESEKRSTPTEEELLGWPEDVASAEADRLRKAIEVLEGEKEALGKKLERSEKAWRAEHRMVEQWKGQWQESQGALTEARSTIQMLRELIDVRKLEKPTRYGEEERQKRGLARKGRGMGVRRRKGVSEKEIGVQG